MPIDDMPLTPAPRAAAAGVVASPPPAAGRIVILFQDFAAGGTERTMIRLANLWSASREVTIVCGSGRGPARARLSSRIRVIEPGRERVRSPLSRLYLARAVRAALPGLAPDVIVGAGNHVLPVLLAIGSATAPAVCKLSNPIVPKIAIGPINRLLWSVVAIGCRRLAGLVALSPALAAEFDARMAHDRLVTIVDPIFERHADTLAAGGTARGTGAFDTVRILCAARLVAQKNVALALHTVACLPGARLVIAGDGPGLRSLERLSRRLGIAERTVFAGHVADIEPLLAESDVLLATSRYEGYPAVLAEAIGAGVPVVTTASTAAVADILSDRSFGRAANADPVMLAAAILETARRGVDNAARSAFVDRHRAEVSAARWLELLDAVAGQARAPRGCGSALSAPSPRRRREGAVMRRLKTWLRMWWDGFD